MHVKPNPKWLEAPYEIRLRVDCEHVEFIETHIKEEDGLKFIDDPFPLRTFNPDIDAVWAALRKHDRSLCVPWFIVEQPDGTWKESW